jgi:excisionase family DNA binding protein
MTSDAKGPDLTRNSVLTMREAAELLRFSKAHLSNVINRKVPGLPALPVVRIGRRLLVRRDALAAWLLTVER